MRLLLWQVSTRLMAWFDTWTQQNTAKWLMPASYVSKTTLWWLRSWQWWDSAQQVGMARAAAIARISISTVVIEAWRYCVSESLCKTAIPHRWTDSLDCIISPASGTSTIVILDVRQLKHHVVVVVIWRPPAAVIFRIFIGMICTPAHVAVVVTIGELHISTAVAISRILLWRGSDLQLATEISRGNWCGSRLALQLQPHQSVYLIHAVDTCTQLLDWISATQRQQLPISAGNKNVRCITIFNT